MSSERADLAAALYFQIAALSTGDREAALARRCGGDVALRLEVERLLDVARIPDTFLDPDAIHRPVVHADTPLTPGTLIGGFTIRRVIGSGGAGIVYLAEQRHPARAVALKVLRRGLDTTSVRRRFELEADLLGRLQNPGIAQIYAAHPGDVSVPPFIAMELVDGEPLTDFAEARDLPVNQRVELLARVCDAVQHAHQRGIIHRDLKPANILVSAGGEPKVLDFGVARAVNADPVSSVETGPGQLVGTIPYMSPEQIRGAEDVDTRSDIYALGAILFRLLTGTLPFTADQPALPELARRIAEDEPPRLGTIVASLRGDLEIIVGCALAKERDRRYSSAADLAVDLRRCMAGEPIAATAASRWTIVARRVARYQRALLASAAAVVLLATLSVYASVQRHRADVANERLARELSVSNLERARALAASGSFLTGEALAWRELRADPESSHALWTLWDIYSRHPALWTAPAPDGGNTTARIHPSRPWVLTAANGSVIRLLDSASGRLVRELRVARGTVTRAIFTPDGRSVAALDSEGSLTLWDPATGAVRHVIDLSESRPFDIAFSHDGGTFVTAGPQRGVEVWTLSGRERVFAGSAGSPRPVIAFDSVRQRLAAGFADGTVRVWNAASGQELSHFQAAGSEVTAIAWHPVLPIVVGATYDQQIHVFDLNRKRHVRTLRPMNGTVRRLAFDRAGRRLAVAGWWRTAIWEVDDTLDVVSETNLSNGSFDAQFSPEGDSIVTAEEAGVRFWRFGVTATLFRIPAHRDRVTALLARSGGAELLTSSVDGSVRVWRSGVGEEAAPTSTATNAGPINAIVGGADARWLASASPSGAEVRASGTRPAMLLPDTQRATALAAASDHTTLVVGTDDGRISAWQIGQGVPVRRWAIQDDSGEVLSMRVFDRYVVAGQRRAGVIVRSLEDGRMLRRVGPGDSAFAVDVSPDGRTIAFSSWTGSVTLADFASGVVRHTLTGHPRVIRGLQFSADSRVLATAGRDGTTRLWDPEHGTALATVAERTPGAERVTFLDGARLAVGYEDGVVDIVDTHAFMRFIAGNAGFHLPAQDGSPGAQRIRDWADRLLALPSPHPPSSSR